MRSLISPILANYSRVIKALIPLVSLATGKAWLGGAGDVATEEDYNSPTSVVIRPDDPSPAYNVRTTFADALAAIQRGSTTVGRLVVDELLVFPYVGAHDGGEAVAVYVDSGAAWQINELVGRYIWNQTDGSTGKITANTATTVTAPLVGGTLRTWAVGDGAAITPSVAIPTGTTWDLRGITLSSVLPLIGVFDLDEGASIEDLHAIEAGASLRSSSSSAAWFPSSPFGAKFKINGGHLVGSHLAPVIEVGAGEDFEIFMTGGTLGEKPHAAIHTVEGGSLRIHLRAGAKIGQNTLSGDNANNVQIVVYDGASEVNLTQDFVAGVINPDYSKSIPQHAAEHGAAGSQELLIEALGSQGTEGYMPAVNAGGGVDLIQPPPFSTYQTDGGAVPVTDQLTLLMSRQPGPGVWNVVFDTTMLGIGTNTGTFGVYKNNVLVGYIRERSLTPTQKGSLALTGQVTLAEGDEVQIKAQASNATGFTASGKSLTLTKVNPV